jgi:IclR family acetate operon transcriptional repressor
VSAENPPQFVQSVEKALAVFECLCQSDSPMRIAELSRRLGMNKTTVFRILQTFKNLGYLDQEKDTDRYMPTLKIAACSNMVLNRVELRAIARDVLRDLALAVEESVHLSMRDHDEVVIIDKVEGRNATRISFHIGRRSPMYVTGTGKVLLSDLEVNDLQGYLARTAFTPRTPNSITTAGALRAELAWIREHGFAYDRAENDPEVACVAAPIRDYSGRVVAAMSIAGVAARIAEVRATLAPQIVRAEAVISSRMGYLPRT